MMSFRRKHRFDPSLNTAALPDLIFTILFFFMIVTHMRTNDVKVRYEVPRGEALNQLANKKSVIHIFIGTPLTLNGSKQKNTRIQVNNKMVDINDVAKYVSALKSQLSPEQQQELTISISADKHTKMGDIQAVKQALREAGTLNIMYTAANKRSEKAYH